jgi:hypothetical protein
MVSQKQTRIYMLTVHQVPKVCSYAEYADKPKPNDNLSLDKRYVFREITSFVCVTELTNSSEPI